MEFGGGIGMIARPISDLFPGVIERAEQMCSFQKLINGCATASARKQMIMTARMGGLISDEETTLLIQAHGLETA